MVSCEKCWGDSYLLAMDGFCNGDRVECYSWLLREREKKGEICTPKEQAGQWWDEEKQIDTRLLKESNNAK